MTTALFDSKKIRKHPDGGGLFYTTAFGDGEGHLYCTYNRLLSTELPRRLPGMKKSERVNVARRIVEAATNAAASLHGAALPPPIVELTNSLAKFIESFAISDTKKRIAIHYWFMIDFFLQQEDEEHGGGTVGGVGEERV